VRHKKRSLAPVLGWTFGVILLALMVRRVGGRVVLDEIREVGVRVLWLLAVYSVGTAFTGVPWYVLARLTGGPGSALPWSAGWPPPA
jgi:hypothetical protein